MRERTVFWIYSYTLHGRRGRFFQIEKIALPSRRNRCEGTVFYRICRRSKSFFTFDYTSNIVYLTKTIRQHALLIFL